MQSISNRRKIQFLSVLGNLFFDIIFCYFVFHILFSLLVSAICFSNSIFDIAFRYFVLIFRFAICAYFKSRQKSALTLGSLNLNVKTVKYKTVY